MEEESDEEMEEEEEEAADGQQQSTASSSSTVVVTVDDKIKDPPVWQLVGNVSGRAVTFRGKKKLAILFYFLNLCFI